jgi:RraA family protein
MSSPVGFRIFTKVRRPPKELVEQFRDLPVANIGDEMNRAACMAARIRPFNPTPLLGTAFTVKSRVGDNLLLHAALDMAEPGDVIVVDAQNDTTYAITGENMMMWAERRKLAGVVIDGAMRDVDSLSKLNIALYASGTQPNGPYKDGPGEINVPITCGGVVVNPGDILVGDADGIVVVPAATAATVLESARAKLGAELKMREEINAGTWSRASYTTEAMRARGAQIIDDVYPG